MALFYRQDTNSPVTSVKTAIVTLKINYKNRGRLNLSRKLLFITQNIWTERTNVFDWLCN